MPQDEAHCGDLVTRACSASSHEREESHMDVDRPQLPYESHRPRRGSSSFAVRLGRALPLRGVSTADWLLIISLIVAASVIVSALYYTR